jgi:mono/diheme cytochrome c family protein
MKSICQLTVFAVLAVGCAAKGTRAEDTEPFTVQAQKGGELYGRHCARCHGADGSGDVGPRLVGLKEGALPLDPPATREFRHTQFRTVADVAAFAVAKMPKDEPGSLAAEDYWRILAFDLKANGIDLKDQHLDGTLAATLVIPR